MSAVEIEVRSDWHGGLFFSPLGRVVRGRLDPSRMNNGEKLRQQFPDFLPGEIIGVDADGQCYTREPLQEPKYAGARDRIARMPKGLRPARESASKNAAAWLFWMMRAVESGAAVVITGKLPDDIEKPDTSFVVKNRKNRDDRLAEAIERLAKDGERQGELLEKLTGLIEKLASKK